MLAKFLFSTRVSPVTFTVKEANQPSYIFQSNYSPPRDRHPSKLETSVEYTVNVTGETLVLKKDLTQL